MTCSASFSPVTLSLSLSALAASTNPFHSTGNLRNHPYTERLWVNALASAINSSFECLKCRVGKLHPVTCARGWLRDATAVHRNAFHGSNYRRSYVSLETSRDDLLFIFFPNFRQIYRGFYKYPQSAAIMWLSVLLTQLKFKLILILLRFIFLFYNLVCCINGCICKLWIFDINFIPIHSYRKIN